MSMDFRGDPASALLEVLDPEQNHTFDDHYLEVDYDLSEVMFVATANSLNIPPALLDRMEVIRLAGYTEDEKVTIAETYLIPKQMKNNGLQSKELGISDVGHWDIVRYYTREAGVRKRGAGSGQGICRKVVTRLGVLQRTSKRMSGAHRAAQAGEVNLGVKRYPSRAQREEQDRVGQVTGLAWTESGRGPADHRGRPWCRARAKPIRTPASSGT